MATKKLTEKIESIQALRKILKPRDTVYCVLRHVSSSGMSLRIDFYVVKKGAIVYLTGWVGSALEYRRHSDGGLVVGGCGMDMGFAVVYNLGETLWPKGTKKPHGVRNGEPDSDGGYALRSEWL